MPPKTPKLTKAQALARAAKHEQAIHANRAERNRWLAYAQSVGGATYAEMQAATKLSSEGVRKAIIAHENGGK